MRKILLTLLGLLFLATSALAGAEPSEYDKKRMAILNVGYAIGALETCGRQFIKKNQEIVDEWFLHGNIAISAFKKFNNYDTALIAYIGRMEARRTKQWIRWNNFQQTIDNTPTLVNLNSATIGREKALENCKLVNIWLKDNLINGFMSKKDYAVPKKPEKPKDS